jgi:hypothetical protein
MYIHTSPFVIAPFPHWQMRNATTRATILHCFECVHSACLRLGEIKRHNINETRRPEFLPFYRGQDFNTYEYITHRNSQFMWGMGTQDTDVNMSKNTRNYKTAATIRISCTSTPLHSSSRHFPTDKWETPQHAQRFYTVSSAFIMLVKAWWHQALQYKRNKETRVSAVLWRTRFQYTCVYNTSKLIIHVRNGGMDTDVNMSSFKYATT